MHIIDIIVFLLFTGGVVAFGCSFFKKKGTSEEFTSAGRSLPGWQTVLGSWWMGRMAILRMGRSVR